MEVMRKVEVVENQEYTKIYPTELPTRITVKTSAGTFSDEIRVPRGHYKNPMSDKELEEKALRLGLSKELIGRIWDLENHEVKDIVAW